MSDVLVKSRDETGVGRRRSSRPDVRALGNGGEAEWDAFVRARPDGTFYHLAGWRRLIESECGHRSHYLVAEADGALVGVLPLFHVKSWLFGNALMSLPFLVYGGPLAESDAARDALVAHAVALAEELGVDQLELRNLEPLPLGSEWVGSETHVTFRKAIDTDPQANLMAIPRKQRAMIRKGIKAGLRYEMDEDVTQLYRAMLECKRNLGTPFFGRRFLQAIKTTFGDQVEILNVLQGTRPVCSVMSFRYADQVLPYYGGGGDLARDTSGNDFMYWCVMERACEQGVRLFDYGRSQVGSGAYRFKKHWGFEPEPLGYQHLLVRASELPALNPANPKYRFAVSAWKRLPLPVASLLGPPLATRLG